jgi:hypothetical protein
VRIAAAFFVVAVSAASVACVSIDPGTNYVVPDEVFNADYFYCFVEPKLIFGKNCGDDGSGGCHYSDKVPAMELIAHPAVSCTGGHPSDPTQIGAGSPAAANLSAVSLEMDSDYLNAPIYIWPTQIVAAHPKQVFTPSDPVVQYIASWAQQ